MDLTLSLGSSPVAQARSLSLPRVRVGTRAAPSPVSASGALHGRTSTRLTRLDEKANLNTFLNTLLRFMV